MPPRTTARAEQSLWPPGSLLAGLSEPARQRLLALGAKSQYADSGRVLIREGDGSTVVFLLLAGTVKVTGATDDGDALLTIRVGGEVVGELAALDGRPRLATVTTAGPVIARVIGRGEFSGLLTRDPELAVAVTRNVAGKLRSATSRWIDFAGCDVTTRLARVLLDLATRYGEQADAGLTIGCPLTQTELATLIGAGEPTVQRTLRQLRADGIISTGYRETAIIDMARLREYAFPNTGPLTRG
ncbi:MAG: transcriptional regulator, Crp/Fnr family [Actinomycetia bacterium]|nr:transcriptional regulator, Crp/Fnr family [Actinomycetes bacterium]